MILLWGMPEEDELAAVRSQLRALDATVVVVDQRQVTDNEIELTVDADVDGRLTVPGVTVELHDVTAVYLRPGSSCRLPEVWREGPGSRLWDHAQAFDEALWAWTDLCDALVVSRPEAMYRAHSKPYQEAFIRNAGFRLPDTLLTTDPDAVREFARRHPAVVYKSMGTVRSVVARLSAEHLNRDRLDDVVTCPTQFQEWIPGVDHRVHVVGEEVFCTTVASSADDYRYPLNAMTPARIRPASLPDEWAERCRRLAASMALPFAGIDLRRTPDGDWYCFEVNPAPAFTYYEGGPNPRVARAVAKLLASAPTEPVTGARSDSIASVQTDSSPPATTGSPAEGTVGPGTARHFIRGLERPPVGDL